MKPKPIQFNTDMVRAILDGNKTVMRRVVKPQPENAHAVLDCDDEAHTFDLLCGEALNNGALVDYAETVKAPYWPGDILYVRETWATWSRTYGTVPRLYYKADGNAPDKIQWRPSIHMPRVAARLFLRVTDVRVERLQDITEEQAVREGVYRSREDYGIAIYAFSDIWDSCIKKSDRPIYGWAANPWVWVIEFERESAHPDGNPDERTGSISTIL